MRLNAELLCQLRAELTRGAYRDVHPDLVDRFLNQAANKWAGKKEVLKRCRLALHQAYGAFAKPINLTGLDRALNAVGGRSSTTALRDLCQRVLKSHPSTRERSGAPFDIWQEILPELGPAARLLDLGCGLNPFFLPWMGLSPSVEYLAVDIGCRLCGVTNRFLAMWGQNGKAECKDVVSWRPEGGFDVVLMQKLLPTLERQCPGIGADLLHHFSGSPCIVSFPTRSLGGRSRGMPQTYQDYVTRIMTGHQRPIRVVESRWETFYLLGDWRAS